MNGVALTDQCWISRIRYGYDERVVFNGVGEAWLYDQDDALHMQQEREHGVGNTSSEALSVACCITLTRIDYQRLAK